MGVDWCFENFSTGTAEMFIGAPLQYKPMQELLKSQRCLVKHRRRLMFWEFCLQMLPKSSNKLRCACHKSRTHAMQNISRYRFSKAHPLVNLLWKFNIARTFENLCLWMSHIEDPRNVEYLQVHNLKVTLATKPIIKYDDQQTMKNDYIVDPWEFCKFCKSKTHAMQDGCW